MSARSRDCAWPARADRSKPRRIPAQDGKHPSAIALRARAPRRLWVNLRRQHSVQGGCSSPNCCRSIRIPGLRLRAKLRRGRIVPTSSARPRFAAATDAFAPYLKHSPWITFAGGGSLQGTLLAFTPGGAWSSFFSAAQDALPQGRSSKSGWYPWSRYSCSETSKPSVPDSTKAVFGFSSVPSVR